MRIYLAGPLFTLAERDFNQRLASAIEKECGAAEVVLSQEETAKLDENNKEFPKNIYELCWGCGNVAPAIQL